MRRVQAANRVEESKLRLLSIRRPRIINVCSVTVPSRDSSLGCKSRTGGRSLDSSDLIPRPGRSYNDSRRNELDPTVNPVSELHAPTVKGQTTPSPRRPTPAPTYWATFVLASRMSIFTNGFCHYSDAKRRVYDVRRSRMLHSLLLFLCLTACWVCKHSIQKPDRLIGGLF